MPVDRAVRILVRVAAPASGIRRMQMRKRWKVALGVVLVPVLGVSALGATGQVRWKRTFDVPEPDLHASADPAVIARGRYLAYGPAHCASCHTRKETPGATRWT